MRRRVNTPSLFLMDPFRWLLWCITFASKDFDIKWDKVFKDGPSKFCGRKPFKKFKGHGLLRQTISLQIFQRFSSTNYTWSIHVRGHPSSNYAKVPEKLTVPTPWGGTGGCQASPKIFGVFFLYTNKWFNWNLFSDSLRQNESNLTYFRKQLCNKGKRKFSASRAVFSCNMLRGNKVTISLC